MTDASFHVVTCNLAPDLCSAAPEYRLSDFGALDEQQLVVVLEMLRTIDPVQNDQASPHVLIEAPAGRFRVHTGQGRLFLHDDAHRAPKTGAELDSAAIARRLAQSPNAAAGPALPVPAGARRVRLKIVFVLLGAAILVIGYHLYSA